MSLLRRPADPHFCGRTKMILNFMTTNGHTSYEADIRNLQEKFEEYQAEAGPNGYLCPFTQETLDELDAEIEEIARAAVDRYEDWASDLEIY